MAYKPTGRPVGRPKTKEYVTLLARVPADLAELVKQYAEQHRQSVAELIREGVEWRIGDGDPRGMGLYLAPPTDASAKMYYTNTETTTESAELLRDIRAEQVRIREELQGVMQALAPRIRGAESVPPTDLEHEHPPSAAVQALSYDENAVLQELGTPVHLAGDSRLAGADHRPVPAPGLSAVAAIPDDRHTGIPDDRNA